MLEAILLFLLSVVGALAPGVGEAPGLVALPELPAVVGERVQEALGQADLPAQLPAGEAALAGAADEELVADAPVVEVVPAEAPPVDVSNAPASIDLSGVPAAEHASVPDTVGAGQVPAQAGPPSEIPAGPPSEIPEPAVEVPANDAADETAACAAGARGAEAAACRGDG